MKTLYILSVLLFLSVNCFCQEIDGDKITRKGLIYLYEGKPLNGKVIIKEKPLILEFNLKNGLQNGLQKEYFKFGDDKILWLTLNAKNGLFHGEMRTFWPNGQLRGFKNYANGKIIGESKEWTEKGLLKKVYIFINGWDHHKQVTYDESKKITRQITIKNSIIIFDSNSHKDKQKRSFDKNDPFIESDIEKNKTHLEEDDFSDDSFEK